MARGRGGQHQGGRGGGGRGRGREGRGGGGGRGSSNDAPFPKEALSNLIPCSISSNFVFYQYGIECINKKGKEIDSRSRRGVLFNMGMFGPDGYLARNCNGMSKKEIEDLRRVLFYQGSYLLSARPIPGVGNNIPDGGIDLVGGGGVGSKNRRSDGVCPTSDNGDSMILTSVKVFCAPLEMKLGGGNNMAKKEPRAAPQAAEPSVQRVSSSMETLTMELRCANCVYTFKDDNSLLMHCRETGHFPVTTPGDDDGAHPAIHPANKEEFIQYANVVLRRALGERLARW